MKSLLPAASRLSIVALISLAAIGAPTPDRAQASGFTFSGRSTGEWGLPSNPSGSTVLSNQNGGFNNRLEWGTTPPECLLCTPFNNYVQYDGTQFSTTANSLFNLGKLTYRNGSTLDSFNGDFPLTVALFFNGTITRNQTFNFLFNILNTENVNNDPVLDGDRLRFSTDSIASQTFSHDGIDYTLQLIGFSTDFGRTIVSEFNSPEGSIAEASLFGKIIPTNACPPQF
jgi:hypothetical protein